MKMSTHVFFFKYLRLALDELLSSQNRRLLDTATTHTPTEDPFIMGTVT